MEEEDLHWLYIFHYWVAKKEPKFENQEDKKKYHLSDEYVFYNQLVFSIIEYCKKLGLKPFQEESEEVFHKFDQLMYDSIDGISYYQKDSYSRHIIKRNFQLTKYLDEAEKPPHEYNYSTFKIALILYLQSPIRNSYLDRFYLFHIIDNEIKEFYSGSNYGTRVKFS